jgi:hypothetical protein
MPEKPGRPHAGAAGEFEYAARRAECLERLSQLIAARKIQGLVQIIRRERPVVGGLLIKQPVEFFAFSQCDRLRPCRQRPLSSTR